MSFNNGVQHRVMDFFDGFTRPITHCVRGTVQPIKKCIERLIIRNLRQGFERISLKFFYLVRSQKLRHSAFVFQETSSVDGGNTSVLIGIGKQREQSIASRRAANGSKRVRSVVPN